jgi:ribosomal protein L11
MLLYNNKPFLQKFSKELTLVLPAQEIKPAPPLSPIIAQFGLSAAEVCDKFNKASIIFPQGVPIPVSIYYTPKEKTFDLSFRPFQLKYILQQYITYKEETRKYQIDLLNLYKVLLIKGYILNLDLKQQNVYLRNIIGSLRSYDRPVEIIFSNLFEEKQIDLNENNKNNKLFLLNNYEIPDIIEDIKKVKIKEILKEENCEEEEEFLAIIEEKTKEEIEEEFFDDFFGIRKIKLYKNKRRIKRVIEKKKKALSLNSWCNIPFALLIYTPKIPDFHYLKRFLYELNECILVRKQRFFYKKNYHQKIHTSFFCYRIFNFDLYKLYEIMDKILEYDISILGIEIHNKIYSLEKVPNFIKVIKKALKEFFNILNNINNEFSVHYFKHTEIDFEFKKNISNILTLCQHTIK